MTTNESWKEQWEIALHIFQEVGAKPQIFCQKKQPCTTQFITHKKELCLS
jgi:hypothetical protein